MKKTEITPLSIPLDTRSKELRKQIITTFSAARRGHIGSALSIVEVLRVLYDETLRFDAKKPEWPDRDRLILSKGHGCLALYVMLAEKDFFSKSLLKTYCAADSIFGGHVSHSIPGVDLSTGSLGHGLPVGVGYSLAARMDAKTYRTFIILGDGELNEGSNWEAAMLASKHQLNNLIALVDVNDVQSYAKTSEVQNMEPLADKWTAFGWSVKEVNGHDVSALQKALSHIPYTSKKPSVILCHTVKGKGIAFAEGNLAWHHRRGVTDSEIDALYHALEEY